MKIFIPCTFMKSEFRNTHDGKKVRYSTFCDSDGNSVISVKDPNNLTAPFKKFGDYVLAVEHTLYNGNLFYRALEVLNSPSEA